MKYNKAKPVNSGDLDKKLTAIASWLENQKAVDPVTVKIVQPNALAEAAVIASATSGRHAQGLARSLLEMLKKEEMDFLHMEGFDVAQWILLDCNDVVIHIFQPQTRDLYRLEELLRQASDQMED